MLNGPPPKAQVKSFFEFDLFARNSKRVQVGEENLGFKFLLIERSVVHGVTTIQYSPLRSLHNRPKEGTRELDLPVDEKGRVDYPDAQLEYTVEDVRTGRFRPLGDNDATEEYQRGPIRRPMGAVNSRHRIYVVLKWILSLSTWYKKGRSGHV